MLRVSTSTPCILTSSPGAGASLLTNERRVLGVLTNERRVLPEHRPEVGAHGGQHQAVTRDPPGVTMVRVTITAEYNVSVLRGLPHRVEHGEGFSEHLITPVNCLHHAIIPQVSRLLSGFVLVSADCLLPSSEKKAPAPRVRSPGEMFILREKARGNEELKIAQTDIKYAYRIEMIAQSMKLTVLLNKCLMFKTLLLEIC